MLYLENMIIGGFTIIKNTVAHLDEQDLALEVAPLPVTESDALPVMEAKVEVIVPAVKTLEQRIAELEDNIVKLQTELNTLHNKKNKKGSKGKKVKCKCKDKTVDIAECKCRSKKLVK